MTRFRVICTYNKIIEDPFFLDLHVKADVESCKMETFNGIKYLDLHSLSADLLIVHKYREMQVPRVESSAREVVAEIEAILNYFKLSFHVTGDLSLKSLLVPILSSDVYHKFYQALDRQKGQDHSCSRLRVILKLLQTGVVDPNFHIEEFLRSNMAEAVNLGAEITETPRLQLPQADEICTYLFSDLHALVSRYNEDRSSASSVPALQAKLERTRQRVKNLREITTRTISLEYKILLISKCLKENDSIDQVVKIYQQFERQVNFDCRREEIISVPL